MTPEEMAAAIEKLNGTTTKLQRTLTTLEQANTESEAEIERLRGANQRLLKDLKKAKVKVTATPDDDDETETPDDDDAPAKKPKKGSVEAQLADLQSKLVASQERLAKRAIEAAITSALDAAKIAPAHRKAVAAMLRSEMEFAADEDGTVTVGETSASEAIAAWAKTDEGKAYVTAPASGGSQGKPSAPNARGNVAQPEAPQDRSKMNAAERGRHARENASALLQNLL